MIKYEDSRFGKIKYTKTFLDDEPEILQKLYAKIVPISINFNYIDGMFEVTAISEKFEPLEQGQIIPEYNILITKKVKPNNSVSITIRFRKCLFT